MSERQTDGLALEIVRILQRMDGERQERILNHYHSTFTGKREINQLMIPVPLLRKLQRNLEKRGLL